MSFIHIYVDGSYRDKKSSSAILVVDDDVLYKKAVVKSNIYSVKYRNFYSELYASLLAVQYAKINNLNNFILYHDYDGIEHLITGKWQLKNELSEKYFYMFNQLTKDINFEFVKVKSHSGNYYNEMVDLLAKKALD